MTNYLQVIKIGKFTAGMHKILRTIVKLIGELDFVCQKKFLKRDEIHKHYDRNNLFADYCNVKLIYCCQKSDVKAIWCHQGKGIVSLLTNKVSKQIHIGPICLQDLKNKDPEEWCNLFILPDASPNEPAQDFLINNKWGDSILVASADLDLGGQKLDIIW